jgi:outer membrane protein assembly factor BamE (lipoprotein component of BamABCDE complex)
MKSNTIPSILVLLVSALALLSPVETRAENDHLIVPWQRVGPITLGMTAEDAIRVLGQPTQSNKSRSTTTYFWKDNMSVTTLTENSYVTQICALNADYATAQGLRSGMPDTSVSALMGEPQSSQIYHDWWMYSYIKLFWGGLMVDVPLTGFDNSHSVRSICVNHSE